MIQTLGEIGWNVVRYHHATKNRVQIKICVIKVNVIYKEKKIRCMNIRKKW